MGAAILQDLVVVMVVAAATTILFYRLRQPVVLGYLLAGFLIGPHTPPFQVISDRTSIDALAELGIIFLMFAVGLEFNLRKLKEVGGTAILAATIEIALMIAIGYKVGMMMGWGAMNSIFLGAILSISSTTIIVKVLMERGEMQEGFAEVAFGILIVEDLLAIVLVAVLGGFGAGTLDGAVLGTVVGRVALFVFIATAVGLVLVPRLIDWVSRFHVEEVLIITVVGLALGGALLAMKLGFSLALGAFLVGAIVSESHAVKRVEHKIVPIRDLFTAVFFVAVGMLIDPAMILQYAVPILLITALTIVGKVVACSVATFASGKDGKTSLRVGMSMAQIGEFSFIIAGLGLALGVMDAFLYPVAVAVCALTTLLSPYLISVSDRIVDRTSAALPRAVGVAGSAYTRSVRRLGARERSAPPRAAKHGTRVLIYAAWLLGLFIAGGYLSLWFGDQVSGRVSVGENLKRASGFVVVGLLGLPFFVAFTKATEAWAHELAKARAFNPNRLAKADPRYRGPRFAARIVAFSSAIGLLVLAGRVAHGVHPIALPSWWLLIPAVGVVTGAGFLVWRRAERLYVWMEETLDMLLDEESEEVEPVQRLRERYPWGVDVEEVPILSSSWGAYTSLRDLNLRETTGCNVLNVERGAAIIANPHPDMALLPGDRIVLVGRRDQLDRAARHLQQRGVARRGATAAAAAAPPPPRSVTEELRIPVASPAVGASLGELAVKERTRATIAEVRRRGTPVPPAASLRLAPGDVLLVVGSSDEVRGAKELLGVRDLPKVGGQEERARPAASSPAPASPSAGFADLAERAGAPNGPPRFRGPHRPTQ